ncbi:Hint domain-containing protein [Pseudogemmobacter humi]|uniref:Hedgehog/Intein (Hint) domain-containing protein n=1 Tax=Pseudogemmobacter humi TaxID=2483812 RepID=A0A3P5XPR3_9RHOB|nr:Hint domain-containing protein [Pseudogemmobacter humi]VDC30778.1 hypothetical protein XINFAN_02685 [Pseudogemmobacter humi]
MATFTLYLTGDQIGTYSSASGQGNGNQMVVTLTNVQALGTENDIYRVVITQANANDTHFRNGMWVSIHTWSEENPTGTPVFTWLNPQDDMYQGRASGENYQIFGSSAPVLIDLRGVGSGTVTYGSEQNEPMNARLPFSGLATDPTVLLPPVICFLRGTRILTPNGLRPVEKLKTGDIVWTRESGMQPIRWIGRSTTSGLGRMAPVRIGRGVLGNERPVFLSPQHRVLLTGWRAQLHFGEDEVLAAAVHLTDGAGIRQVPRAQAEYWHIAFARHEIVCAEGMFAESLLPGPMALEAVSPEARAELEELFPELLAEIAGVQTAHRCLTRREAGLLRAV